MLQAVKQQGKIAMQQNQIAEPGFEPGLPDSESGVITTTLYRRCGCGCCEIPEIATYIQFNKLPACQLPERIATSVPKLFTDGCYGTGRCAELHGQTLQCPAVFSPACGTCE